MTSDSKAQTPAPADPIRYEYGQLDPIKVKAFEQATRSTHTAGDPPTFFTVFRLAEFDWLQKLKVDFRNLLHTDQEYEFHESLVEHEKIFVETHLKDLKERRGMRFITLETTISSGRGVRAKATTRFVIREPQKAGA